MALTPVLTIPTKTPAKLDWVSPLKKHIKSEYSKKDVESFSRDVQEIQALRDSVKAADGSTEVAVDVMLKYYHVLDAIDRKFAFSEGSSRVKMQFGWADAFKKRNYSDITSGAEEGSVLFNVAAIYSQMGSRQTLSSSDGLKLAAKYFQDAAGFLSFVKEHVKMRGISPDMQDDVLDFLQNLMLAQAQECFYGKAYGDKIKEGVLSKLAKNVGEAYEHASATLASSQNMKDWGIAPMYATQCKIKALAFLAIAYMHEGTSTFAAEKYGVGVGWMRRANNTINEAIKASKSSDYAGKVKDLSTKIATDLAKMERDNTKIYAEPVPGETALPNLEGKCMVKPSALPDLGAKFGPVMLFANLIPAEVQKAAQTYAEKKNALVRSEIAALDEQTTLCRSQLASMNLPAAVDAILGASEGGLPDGLRQKKAAMAAEGGVGHLFDLLNTLEEVRAADNDIVQDIVRRIDAEEDEDRNLRARYGQSWRRTPSRTINASHRREAESYVQTLRQASDADAIVKSKFTTTRDSMVHLEQDEAVLLRNLRSGNASQEAKTSQVVMSLRELLLQMDTLIAQRENFKNELRTMAEADDPIGHLTILMSGMNADQAINQEMDKYSGMRSKREQGTNDQTALMERIRVTNEDFVRSRTQVDSATSEREQLFQKLEVASNMYQEIQTNLREGIHFYTQFQETLSNFGHKIEDFVFARQTERDDLMASFHEAQPQPQPGYVPGYPSVPANPYPGHQQAPQGYGYPPPRQ